MEDFEQKGKVKSKGCVTLSAMKPSVPANKDEHVFVIFGVSKPYIFRATELMRSPVATLQAKLSQRLRKYCVEACQGFAENFTA